MVAMVVLCMTPPKIEVGTRLSSRTSTAGSTKLEASTVIGKFDATMRLGLGSDEAIG